MVYACLFIFTIDTSLCWAEGWYNKWFAINKQSNFLWGSYTRQTEVVIIKEKSLNHKGLGGYSWTKPTISHAPQVSTWEVSLNSLAPKPGQQCPTWWLSISMATHHRGMYPGRGNTFMCQPPLGDKPGLKFPEALSYKWHGIATWLLSFKRTSYPLSYYGSTEKRCKENWTERQISHLRITLIFTLSCIILQCMVLGQFMETFLLVSLFVKNLSFMTITTIKNPNGFSQG